MIGGQTSQGRPAGFRETRECRYRRLDIHTALRSHTLWAARQLFLEQQTGSLEVGKLADIAVWDRNPYAVPTAAIKDMRCMMTLFAGKVVYVRR